MSQQHIHQESHYTHDEYKSAPATGHPFASRYNLPSEVTDWRQGQPVPQGWRVGRKGYLKPVFTPPPHLSSWQQGQPIPEGYKLTKSGTLRPVDYFAWWSSTAATTRSPNIAPSGAPVSYGSGGYVSSAPSPYSTTAPAYGAAVPATYTTYESYTSQHSSHTPPGQSLTQDLMGATKEMGHRCKFSFLFSYSCFRPVMSCHVVSGACIGLKLLIFLIPPSFLTFLLTSISFPITVRDKLHNMAVQHEQRPTYTTTENVTRETTYKPLP